MRKYGLWSAAGAAALTAGAASPGWAQAPAEDVSTLEQVVVVGSRGKPRLATDTSAPVDVFSGEELAQKGFNELTKALEFLSPSFNYPRVSSGPSTQGARPARLRGLGPDQVLVLVNGRRRHASSLITFNNTPGRGSVPIDFNTIPMAAIERIEVLRDGAAAQYGSDAIAGVINIVLRDDRDGGLVSMQYGETERGQGETFITRGRIGLPLGDGGFLTLSGEINDRDDTNAAEIDPRFGRITSTLGDSPATDVNVALNAAMPLGEVEVYGFATYGHRDAEASPLFRAPSVAPLVYPQGFLPIVNLELHDVGANIGVRGQVAGWDWDLSDTYGFNRGDYRVSNTTNTSLGPASPTAFYGGAARYGQNLINLSVGRDLDLAAGAHLAAGLEHRHEFYELLKGDETSYTLAGAQGFPGFNPPSPVDVSRDAVSAFLDGELNLTPDLDLGAAVRYEDYSDFGDQVTGKVSLFWRPMSAVAFRATASTGFRAPSLQQQFFSTVTSQRLPNGEISNVGTFAVNDRVSVALGASPLKAETSTSYSAGVVLTPFKRFSLSIDAFRIDIDDRIALSENIQGPAVTAILRANGVTNASVARFFTNAADTRTEGFEATARWETELSEETRLTLTAGYASVDNDLTRLASNPVLPQVALLGDASIFIMLDGLPRTKALLDTQLDWRDLRLNLSAVTYGSTFNTTINAAQEGSTSFEVSLGYQISEVAMVTVGVINLFDEYPPRVPDATGRPYSEISPLGFNGREYFLRVAAEF